MAWTWEKIVRLNELICEASGQPHAVRQSLEAELEAGGEYNIFGIIAEEHPFIEGNKRTAACLAICLALEKV